MLCLFKWIFLNGVNKMIYFIYLDIVKKKNKLKKEKNFLEKF